MRSVCWVIWYLDLSSSLQSPQLPVTCCSPWLRVSAISVEMSTSGPRTEQRSLSSEPAGPVPRSAAWSQHWQPDPGRPPLTVWRVAWPECLMSARSQTCYTPGDSRLNWTSWAHNQNEMRSEVAHGNSKIITKSASLITWIVFVDK